MRRDHERVRDLLSDAWERWARRCAELTPAQWHAKTRCEPWEVAALVAHVCPEPTTFAELAADTAEGPAAVTDAAMLLRTFNEPDGVAVTTGHRIAASAAAEADGLTPDSAAGRFTECAVRMRGMAEMTDGNRRVIRYPVIGTTTLAVVAEVALVEATVHLLDLADAVGGVLPSPDALAATRDLLIAIPDPLDAVEVLAGRRDPGAVLPTIH